MRRRTMKRYQELYRNPRSLFSGGPDDTGVSTILFPNGANEIWLQTASGEGVRIVASNGPHGLGIRVSTFAGTPALTVAGGEQSTREVEICQYRQNPDAQAFRRWYNHAETPEDVARLGPSYLR